MTDAIEALSADREAVLEICRGLSSEIWNTETGCAGWSVKDLIAHLGALFWAAVDPSVLPEVGDLRTEEANEAYVAARRSLSPDDVLADYAVVSERGLSVLAGLVGADFELPLGDLGTYPAAVIPAAFCFDHYTHIRFDLFAPSGPLPGSAPSSDARRVHPTLDWIEAALPQQNRAVLSELHGSVEIAVTGVTARTMHLGPDGPLRASVRADADSCVRWITKRATAEEAGVEVSGEEEVLALVGNLKVF
jgi:uncharacterized protein (TIGR03083 family)